MNDVDYQKLFYAAMGGQIVIFGAFMAYARKSHKIAVDNKKTVISTLNAVSVFKKNFSNIIEDVAQYDPLDGLSKTIDEVNFLTAYLGFIFDEPN